MPHAKAQFGHSGLLLAGCPCPMHGIEFAPSLIEPIPFPWKAPASHDELLFAVCTAPSFLWGAHNNRNDTDSTNRSLTRGIRPKSLRHSRMLLRRVPAIARGCSWKSTKTPWHPHSLDVKCSVCALRCQRHELGAAEHRC